MIINTDDYIGLYHDCFEKKILQKTIKELQSLPSLKKINFKKPISDNHWQSHSWIDPATGKNSVRSKNELESTRWLAKDHKYYMDVLHKYIGEYIKQLKHSHFCGWAGYSQLTFHRYKKETNMDSHIDHIQTIFDGKIRGVPILSVVGQLNDNFEGGEFVVQDKKIKMKAGDILIFPSNFLFVHRVNTITKGTRLSFISWVY
jgi:predicted 2-oxoglutarate/Fe(II)-dependent dioxygenase YbiX